MASIVTEYLQFFFATPFLLFSDEPPAWATFAMEESEVTLRGLANSTVNKAAGKVTKSVKTSYGKSVKGGTSTVQKVFTDNPFDEARNLKPNIKYQMGEFKYNYEQMLMEGYLIGILIICN